MLITITNVKVITLLHKRKRNTSNIALIALSYSDLAVGGLLIPVYLMSDYAEDALQCYSETALQFLYYPLAFSWNMTMVIAIERYLIVTRPAVKVKYITKNTIYYIILINLIIYAGLVLWDNITIKISALQNYSTLPERIAHITSVVLALGIIIFVCYTHLIISVRRQARAMRNCRHTYKAHNYSKRTTKNVGFLLLCLGTCYLISVTFRLFLHGMLIKNDRIIFQLQAWSILVVCANSLFNSIILLGRMTTEKQKINQSKKPFPI